MLPALLLLTIILGTLIITTFLVQSKKNSYNPANIMASGNSCNILTSPETCESEFGCEWTEKKCSQFRIEDCPDSKCYVRSLMRECYYFSQTECENNPRPGCAPEYITGNCVDLKQKNTTCGQWNNYEYQCKSHSNECRWAPLPKQYVRCGGSYIDAYECAPRTYTDTEFPICTSCNTICSPESLSCADTLTIMKCRANGCGYNVDRICAQGTNCIQVNGYAPECR